jgi:hypothetical protein
MAKYTKSTGGWKLVVLEPRITRAFWSRRRAWQAEEVKLHVETRYVPDGTKLTLEIWEDGTDENKGDELVAQIAGEGHAIENGRYETTWTIQLDPDTLGKDLELEGDAWEFYFVVRIEAPALTGRSDLLYVDLQPMIVSM